MGQAERIVKPHEETPVDDVRRVREKLSEEFQNDVGKLAEHVRRVADGYRTRLGLKSVKGPKGAV